VALAAGGIGAGALELLAAGPAADQPREQVGVALGAAAVVSLPSRCERLSCCSWSSQRVLPKETRLIGSPEAHGRAKGTFPLSPHLVWTGRQ
jgi:hypothetical protein